MAQNIALVTHVFPVLLLFLYRTKSQNNGQSG